MRRILHNRPTPSPLPPSVEFTSSMPPSIDKASWLSKAGRGLGRSQQFNSLRSPAFICLGVSVISCLGRAFRLESHPHGVFWAKASTKPASSFTQTPHSYQILVWGREQVSLAQTTSGGKDRVKEKMGMRFRTCPVGASDKQWWQRKEDWSRGSRVSLGNWNPVGLLLHSSYGINRPA